METMTLLNLYCLGLDMLLIMFAGLLGHHPPRPTGDGRPGPRRVTKRTRRQSHAHWDTKQATCRGNGPPGTKHVDTPPRVQGCHRGIGTAPAPAHGRLKISNRRHPAGLGEGRTAPPSTYGGMLKVSGRANPAGRNNTATALWEQLRRHGRRLGSLSSPA